MMEIVVDTVEASQQESLQTFVKKLGHGESSTRWWYPAAELVGHHVYAVGALGVHAVGDTVQSAVAILDIVRNRWLWVVCQGPSTCGGVSFLYDDALYWFGSKDWLQLSSRDISKFDFSLQEWSYSHSTGARPEHRMHSTGQFVEEQNLFVLFGGQATRYPNGPWNDIHLLSMPEVRWVKPKVKGTAPSPRFHACSLL